MRIMPENIQSREIGCFRSHGSEYSYRSVFIPGTGLEPASSRLTSRPLYH